MSARAQAMRAQSRRRVAQSTVYYVVDFRALRPELHTEHESPTS